jgi:hypothetical protein
MERRSLFSNIMPHSGRRANRSSRFERDCAIACEQTLRAAVLCCETTFALRRSRTGIRNSQRSHGAYRHRCAVEPARRGNGAPYDAGVRKPRERVRIGIRRRPATIKNERRPLFQKIDSIRRRDRYKRLQSTPDHTSKTPLARAIFVRALRWLFSRALSRQGFDGLE